MKIMWSSNGIWVKSGYGNQTAMFAPRIRDAGYDIAIQAFFGLMGGALRINDIPTYPGSWDRYGQDTLYAHALHFQDQEPQGPCVVITLIDAWVVNPAPLAANGLRFAPWFPIDMEPIPPPVLKVVKEAWQPIVYSRFAAQQCHNVGLNAMYVPHGVETSVYTPGDKRAARAKLDLPQDAFLVGMVAANNGYPPRKCFPQALLAFRELLKQHPDALMYIHTHPATNGENQGTNMPELVNLLGIQERVLFPSEYHYVVGYPDQHMTDLYQSFDVLLSPSMGEGFGLPILEAQACGTPVIVGDWTSMSELCHAGWKIPKSEAEPFYMPLASWQWIPRIGAIADALRLAYDLAQDRLRSAALAEHAREFAMRYDADLVTRDFWLPALKSMEERIEAGERAMAEVA